MTGGEPEARTRSYPHTIDNGGGERLTFEARRRDEHGEYLEGRNTTAPGAGPPMHVHHLQEETVTVERGTLGYQRKGGAEQTARPGETVTFAPGDAHRFWNAGADELVCTGVIRPPGNVEYFLGEIFASMRRHGGKRPGLFDAAYLSHRYRSEFEILEAPAPVRRLVFPLIAATGRLVGLHRRFAGAPEPLRRVAPGPRRCACDDAWISRRDLAHVLDALAVASRAEAGVGVAVSAIDERIGRGRGDMRTPLNLGALRADGLVEELEPGVWALTAAGVQRLRDDEELATQ